MRIYNKIPPELRAIIVPTSFKSRSIQTFQRRVIVARNKGETTDFQGISFEEPSPTLFHFADCWKKLVAVSRQCLRLESHVLAVTAYKDTRRPTGTVENRETQITSGSHLVTTKVNPRGAAWKSLRPTLSLPRAPVYCGEITVSKVRGNRLNADPRPVTVPGIVDLFQTRPNLISSVVICWSLMLLRVRGWGGRYIASLLCCRGALELTLEAIAVEIWTIQARTTECSFFSKNYMSPWICTMSNNFDSTEKNL